ncbi:heptaprenyl diphosphate synthase component II [Bacillus kwashiorkori]|uniref:heptaprenyl diphosphate synthase component II n=1 Tax=Bacillus kwashiorkori TaxID=1522318 RepID=UPI0007813DE1|nr:heptaprenyl diphosphate synthase component II [Bacillus kwashiorkori]
MNFKTVYALLKNDLKNIEKELEVTLNAKSPLLKQASLHYLQAGGKRIRPILVILASKFGTADVEKVKNVAVSLEMIHMASLIHDDVIDNAELRRGRLTVKAKWDNRVAMYVGDYILARSLELITKVQEEKAHQILSKTMVELSIGEIEQIRDKYNFDQSIFTYFRRIKRKTALLISASCELGAICANATEDVQVKLRKFGYYAGMAFQITDDILDFTATEKQLGKPAGSDLLQGNITLPVFFALKDELLAAEIRQVHENMDLNKLKRLIKAIKATDAIEKSIVVSNQYLQKALEILKGLPDNEAKDLLTTVINFIGKRNF